MSRSIPHYKGVGEGVIDRSVVFVAVSETTTVAAAMTTTSVALLLLASAVVFFIGIVVVAVVVVVLDDDDLSFRLIISYAVAASNLESKTPIYLDRPSK